MVSILTLNVGRITIENDYKPFKGDRGEAVEEQYSSSISSNGQSQ